jgi:hypothetical protein
MSHVFWLQKDKIHSLTRLAQILTKFIYLVENLTTIKPFLLEFFYLTSFNYINSNLWWVICAIRVFAPRLHHQKVLTSKMAGAQYENTRISRPCLINKTSPLRVLK